MACICAFAPHFAMNTTVATTQLAQEVNGRVISWEHPAPHTPAHAEERQPRLSWVVVTENNGCRSLRILWR